MKRLEVRCCCQPTELLGTLPAFDRVGVGERVAFTVMKPRDRKATDARLSSTPPRITLEVCRWCSIELTGGNLFERNVQGGIAFKADGVPIETLRLIPGFIEEQT